MTDTVLIERYLSGDIDAFNMLVGKWKKPIYNYILRITGDAETAKDVCQVTFIQVYKKVKRLRDREKFSSWIYRIASNLCYDEFKKMNHRAAGGINEADLHHQDTHQRVKTPEDICHERQIAVILQNALLSLPAEQRTVIILKQYQGLKFTEIADTLDQPLNTVKSRMYYGLRAMKQYLVTHNLDKEVLPDEMQRHA